MRERASGTSARFDAARAVVGDFGGEFLVECPRCDGCARVRDRGPDAGARRVVLACSRCGHSAVWEPAHAGTFTSSSTSWYPRGAIGVGAAVDWYFHLPLWLRAPCCGETLWAYNAAHLDFLEGFVGAALRERTRDPELGWSNRSMASRLPGWMQLAANRRAVLDCIARLRSGRLREAAG